MGDDVYSKVLMLPRMGEESGMWCDVYNDEVLQQVSVCSGLIEVVLKCGLRLVRQSASTARVQSYKHLREVGTG